VAKPGIKYDFLQKNFFYTPSVSCVPWGLFLLLKNMVSILD